MSVIKNRTVIGILCIVLSLVICFVVTPLFNKSISKKTEIVRVVKPIKIGDEITKDMVKRVEVGAYNLPEDVVRTMEEVTGKYASAAMVPGDYIIHSKIKKRKRSCPELSPCWPRRNRARSWQSLRRMVSPT